MSKPLLSVKDLFCERDDRVLFECLSFSVSSGDIVQIEGPNGSGKTSLLRILAGLSRQFEGDVLWLGQENAHKCDDFYNNLLYFGHQAGVKAALTPRENLRWYAAMFPNIQREDIDQALKKVGLEGFEDVPCSSLSAGQHRRVSLARLHISQSLLWILDEPFTAIDKAGVLAQESLLCQHAASGGAVILTTHHTLSLPADVRKVNLSLVNEMSQPPVQGNYS